MKARIAERTTGLKYVVLDDLKDSLDPKFYEEVYNPKEKSAAKDEANFQERKSAAFMSVPRGRGEKRRDFCHLPESISTVPYNPNEICKKQPITKRKNPAQNVFKIPRPKSPVDLENNDKKKVDPQKEKKQANIARLKKQLALRLWE